MADPITAAEMRELLRDQGTHIAGLIKGGGGGNFAPPPSSLGGGGGSGLGKIITGGIDVLGTAAKEAAGMVGSLGTGAYTARDALTSFSNVIGSISTPLGTAFGKMGGAVMDANDRMKETAKVGVDFAGDLGKANKAVVDSGATQQQFADEMRKNASSYSGMGPTMNKAIENVLGFSRDLQETPAIEQMKAAGTTQQEVAELAMISMKERRGLDLNDKAARQNMLDNTIALSGEMNEVARLTGVSRQEQMAKLAKDKENVMVQAELMGMDKDATNRYDLLKTKLGPLGDSVSKLADEIFTGGVRTKEGSDRMAALGPAGKAFEQAVLAQKNATTTAQKDAANAAMEKAKADIAAYQKSEQYLSQVKLDRSSVGDEARKMMGENKELKGRQTAEATANAAAEKEGKPAATAAEIQAARKETVKQDTARVGPDGKPLAGSEVSSTINNFDQRLYQESKQMADIFKEINTAAGKTIQETDKGQALKRALNPRVEQDGEMLSRSEVPNGTAVGTIKPLITGPLTAPMVTTPTVPSRSMEERRRSREERNGPGTRAEGGPVEPNTPYWVGEEGPELMMPQGAGTIVPTDKIKDMSKEAIPFDDINKILGDMPKMMQTSMPDFSTLFDSMPDLASLLSDKLPAQADFADLMPDMNTMFGDFMPSEADFADLMPDMKTMFGDFMPSETDFASLMPDMDSMFGDIMPSEADMADMMPDFDSMFNDLATISPLSSSDSLNMPDIGPPPSAKSKGTSYDDFGNEVSTTSPTAEEKESMTSRAEPADGATLSDLKEQLVQLNTAVMELVAHSAQTAENSGATVKATKDLNGNLFA